MVCGQVFGRAYINDRSAGTSVFLTWIDRQNVIESRVIDLVKELPYFLLLLLILQRFDDAKWGYLSECPDSKVKTETKGGVLVASLAGDDKNIIFYPDIDDIYLGTTLIGRGTSVNGGKIGLVSNHNPGDFPTSEILRNGNDIMVKIYWPEEARKSEVEILKKAEECGKKIKFIENHIPEMVFHQDPNFLCSSTKMIREFLGLPTNGSRRLRIIAFRRLQPIRKLEEKEMLKAYLDCFFCKYREQLTHRLRVLTSPRYRPFLFVEDGDSTRGR